MRMPRDLPERTKTYVGPLNDTTIWDRFTLRPDDVIISTPPKCGTTWTQSLTAMLIHGKPGMDVGIGEISPWLDCGFRDRDEMTATLDAQTHRRCIKTHTPLDGITYDQECTYIAVYRHPLDVHFSMRTHAENIRGDMLHRLRARFPEDIAAGFDMYIDGISPDGSNEDMTLDSVAYHFQSFRKWAHLPNVHVFHYADLSGDLAGQTARLAAILGYGHAPDLMASIVDGARFATMQSNARAHTRTSSVLADPAAFFASGTSEKWRKHLDDAQIARYRARIADLLPAADIAWIEHGGALPA